MNNAWTHLCAAATALLLFSESLSASDFSIRSSTDKGVAIYQPGEKMVFTFRVMDGETPVAGKTLRWFRTGDDGKTEHGEGLSDEDGLVVSTAMQSPGFVRIKVEAIGEDGKPLEGKVTSGTEPKTGPIFFDGGACVDPDKLRAVGEPEDFDAFWKSAGSALERVPMDAVRKELPCKSANVKLYAVTVACAGPKPVTGYLSIPTDMPPRSFPAVVTFHGYGVRKHWPPESPSQSAITLDINAHGMAPDSADASVEKLREELKNYGFDPEENKKPETTYFYGMALRVLRALQYVKSLPEWNGKDLECNGPSQGGLQAMWAAGLDPDVSSCRIWSPWCCDLGGITLGRLRGWRSDHTRALDYFDPVFHAKRARAKIHLIANFGDYTCPPSGVWILYNNIPHPKKSLEVNQGCTHGFEMKGRRTFCITPAGTKSQAELPESDG